VNAEARTVVVSQSDTGNRLAEPRLLGGRDRHRAVVAVRIGEVRTRAGASARDQSPLSLISRKRPPGFAIATRWLGSGAKIESRGFDQGDRQAHRLFAEHDPGALRSPEPPRYGPLPKRPSKLDPFLPAICELLDDEPTLSAVRNPGGDREARLWRRQDDPGRPVPRAASRFPSAAPRSIQRTVDRPGELAQFDLCEPRTEIPVGWGQTRKGYLVTCKLPYSRAFAGALVFSKEWEEIAWGMNRCLATLGALPNKLVWDREGGIHAGGGQADAGLPTSVQPRLRPLRTRKRRKGGQVSTGLDSRCPCISNALPSDVGGQGSDRWRSQTDRPSLPDEAAHSNSGLSGRHRPGNRRGDAIRLRKGRRPLARGAAP
jgi:hypothetical protein